MLPSIGDIGIFRRLLDVIDSVVIACEWQKVVPLSANVVAERVLAALGDQNASVDVHRAQLDLCRDLAQMKLATCFDPSLMNEPVFGCPEAIIGLWPRSGGKYPDYVRKENLSEAEARSLYYALQESAESYRSYAETLQCEFSKKFANMDW